MRRKSISVLIMTPLSKRSSAPSSKSLQLMEEVNFCIHVMSNLVALYIKSKKTTFAKIERVDFVLEIFSHKAKRYNAVMFQTNFGVTRIFKIHQIEFLTLFVTESGIVNF